VRDLVDDIVRRNAFPRQTLNMLRTTVKHLSRCLGRTSDRILASELKPSLTHVLWTDLNERKYPRNSSRTFPYLLPVLIREAERAGFVPPASAREGAWRPFRAAIKATGLRQIIDEAVHEGKSPADYTDADLDSWGARKLDEGCGYNYVKDCKVKFRRLLFAAGLNREMPRLSPPSARRSYGIPLKNVAEPLRTEVKNLKAWKTEECAEGRGYMGRHREVTAST
jgi:hypothetical protein